MKTFLRGAVGLLWTVGAFLGVCLFLIGLWGIVDPSAFRAADEYYSDTPPSGRSQYATMMGAGAVLVLWPLPFVFRSVRTGRRSDQP